MSIRRAGLTLLILFIAGGLIAMYFTPAIATTLALQPTARTGSTPPPAQSTVAPTIQTTVAPIPQSNALPGGVTLLAQDTFQRADQQFWGNSSDGRTWKGDANTNPDFSIVNHTGEINGGQDGGAMQALMNVNNDNAELVLSGTVSQFNKNRTTNFGGVLRWTDNGTWYKIYIDGSHLVLLRSIKGQTHWLHSQPFIATGGTNYTLRFRVQGAYILGKVWPTAQTEPANWTFTVIDTALTSGFAGVRVVLTPGTTVQVTSFLETTVPNLTD